MEYNINIAEYLSMHVINGGERRNARPGQGVMEPEAGVGAGVYMRVKFPLTSVLWLYMLFLNIHGWKRSQSSSTAPAADDVKLTNHFLQPLETQQSFLEIQRLLMLMLYSSVLIFSPKRPK